jgi:lipopolysaccharide biosynthesis glycosyltransferase
MQDSKGFLYIANGIKYVKEAEISATSLRRFTQLPICLITNENNYSHPSFDHIAHLHDLEESYGSKISGLLHSPFDKTVFLDSDTFVCAPIDQLFGALDIFDLAMTVDNFVHSYSFFKKYRPDFNLRYQDVIPEYNTGVIAIRKNIATTKLLTDWMEIHEVMNIKADMGSFREAYLNNALHVRITPIPFEYNYHGTHSFGFLYNEVKVIHERLGERWNTLTTMMLSYNEMDRWARRLNKYKVKRVVIPYFGVIPYMWSPFSLKKRIKKMFGIKRTKKAQTFS